MSQEQVHVGSFFSEADPRSDLWFCSICGGRFFFFFDLKCSWVPFSSFSLTIETALPPSSNICEPIFFNRKSVECGFFEYQQIRMKRLPRTVLV